MIRRLSLIGAILGIALVLLVAGWRAFSHDGGALPPVTTDVSAKNDAEIEPTPTLAQDRPARDRAGETWTQVGIIEQNQQTGELRFVYTGLVATATATANPSNTPTAISTTAPPPSITPLPTNTLRPTLPATASPTASVTASPTATPIMTASLTITHTPSPTELFPTPTHPPTSTPFTGTPSSTPPHPEEVCIGTVLSSALTLRSEHVVGNNRLATLQQSEAVVIERFHVYASAVHEWAYVFVPRLNKRGWVAAYYYTPVQRLLGWPDSTEEDPWCDPPYVEVTFEGEPPVPVTPLPTSSPTPTPTSTPEPQRFAVLRVVSAPDKNVRALCSLNGGIIGSWAVGVARAVFSVTEADGFIWANQGYEGDSSHCTAIGYRSSSGVVWWIRLVSGDLPSLPGWPGDMDQDQLPAPDRTFDTTKVGVALHMLPGADYNAIFRHAEKWAGSVTFDLNWWAGAQLRARNPNAENICRTTRWGDGPISKTLTAGIGSR